MIAPLPRRKRIGTGEVRRTPRRLTSTLKEYTQHAKAPQQISVKRGKVMRQSPNGTKYVRLDTDLMGSEDGVDYPVYTALTSTVVDSAGGPTTGTGVLVWRLDGGQFFVTHAVQY